MAAVLLGTVLIYIGAPGAGAAGPAVAFGLGGVASPTAGTSFNFPVNALGADSLPTADYRGTVHFTSSDPNASLPADHTYTAADNGTHQFSATFRTGGSQTITVADTGSATVTGSRTYTVRVPAATRFDVGTVPQAAVVGAPLGLVVKAVPFVGGTPDAGYRGTVTFTSTDPGAGLPVDYTFTEDDAGTHVFCPVGQGSDCSGGVVFSTVGNQHTVTVTDKATPSVTGTSNFVVVTSNEPARLVLFNSSVARTGGEALVRVAVVNSQNSLLTTFTGTVGLTSTDPLAVMPPDYTYRASDQGEHNFFVRMGSVGTFTVTAIVRSAPSVTGTSGAIVVTLGEVTPTTSTTTTLVLASNARVDEGSGGPRPTAATVVPGLAGASGIATKSSPPLTGMSPGSPAASGAGPGLTAASPAATATATTTTPSATRPGSAVGGALARTGAPTAGVLALGAVSLAAGLWSIVASRRSTHRSRDLVAGRD